MYCIVLYCTVSRACPKTGEGAGAVGGWGGEWPPSQCLTTHTVCRRCTSAITEGIDYRIHRLDQVHVSNGRGAAGDGVTALAHAVIGTGAGSRTAAATVTATAAPNGPHDKHVAFGQHTHACGQAMQDLVAMQSQTPVSQQVRHIVSTDPSRVNDDTDAPMGQHRRNTRHDGRDHGR